MLDAIVALVLLVPFMAYYGIAPSWRVLWLPVALAAALPAALGLGLWFAAVAAKYRDFRNIAPFLVMILLYVSPVAFSIHLIPEAWLDVYWLNPLVGVIEGWRWILFGTMRTPPLAGALGSAVISLLLLIYGYRYFRRAERSVVDDI
jgi:lipopolysaccharide transport system permease protein